MFDFNYLNYRKEIDLKMTRTIYPTTVKKAQPPVTAFHLGSMVSGKYRLVTSLHFTIQNERPNSKPFFVQ